MDRQIGSPTTTRIGRCGLNTTHTLLFLLALWTAGLTSAVVAVTLARWQGDDIPAALIRGGMAFVGALTVCCSIVVTVRS